MFSAAAAAASTPHGAPPAAVNVTHDVLRNGVHIAVIHERFETADGRYSIVSESKPIGLFKLLQPRPAVLTSAGEMTADGLRPVYFEGSRGANDTRRVEAQFDWSASALSLMHDGNQDTLPLAPGTQDRLSIMYQFMFYPYQARRELEFAMTNGRKLDRYRYAIHRNVEIDTPLGRMRTLHLVKQRDPGDTETEVWLAPEHRYLPVRMVIVESDGVRYEQLMTSLEIRP
jgi:hypothetical protein